MRTLLYDMPLAWPGRRTLPPLYALVLAGVGLGALLGAVRPSWGIALKPMADGFLLLIRMLVPPILFLTVSGGIARMGDLRRVGTVGLKALVYFEVMSTVALALGLLVGNLLHPGLGLHARVDNLDARALAPYVRESHEQGPLALHAFIPDTFFSALTSGQTLQVLFVAVLVGLALALLQEKVSGLLALLEQLEAVVFKILGLLLWLAPLGALGAMAFTVGAFGLSALARLSGLVLTFYATAVLFMLLALGAVARWAGFRILSLVAHFKEELLLVLGTSSSESALTRVMDKLEGLGCDRAIVHLVVPTGYSFNLDGTAIYLTLATLFVAQALDVHVAFGEELWLLLVLMVTSKGAATVTGGGFITLAATLAATGNLPVAGLTLLLGVDRFMSEARALTNLMGNVVATLAIAKWEGGLAKTGSD
jgi:aerobic C4-dicarboxylate transport protein